jgi:hypothetical protein
MINTVPGISIQMVEAWSKIKAVRRVVKQLPAEMLQQRSSASISGMHCHRDTKPEVSISLLLFCMPIQFF